MFFFIKFTTYNRKCCLKYDDLNIYPGFLSCPQPDGLSRLYDSCLDNFLDIYLFTRNVGSCMKAKKLFKRLVDSFLILTSIKSFDTLQMNITEFHIRSHQQLNSLPGPSNNHSSPATRFSSLSSISRMALNLNAAFAITILRAVTVSFKTSPGYRGNGS